MITGSTRLYKPSGLIQIVNRTSKIRDARWQYALPCWQYELSVNFARYWGVDYDLEFVGSAEEPSATAFKMWLLDKSDMAGALGYHTTDDANQPYGRVFVVDDINDGVEITATVDHEIKELAADPSATRIVGPDNQGRHFSVEPCDAVEDDRYSHIVAVGDASIKCSNFVTPLYYGLTNADGSDKLDYDGRLTARVPALLPGGYQEYADPSSQWHQLTARLEDGSASVRSRHVNGRSTKRAAMHLDMMTIEPSSLAA